MSHDQPPSSGSEPDDSGKRRAEKKRGLVRRHPVVTSVLLLFTLIVVGVGGFLLYLNSLIGDVAQVDVAGERDESERPPKIENESMNILLAGVDKGDGRSVAELVEDGWEPGVFRSDTIMVLHVTADRDHAYLVSIPRDSYVRIYDQNGNYQEMSKINEALSVHGPAAYVATIEELTDLRMDHFAAVDWQGFKDISTALGGVEVYIPETFEDTSQNIQWFKGTTTLEGDEALAYVRTRYGLEDGDFGRIARQQNFMRAMVGKMLSQGTLVDPFKLTNTLKAVVNNLTVDDEFDTGEIRDLALSLRGIRTDDLTFLTAPWSGYGTQEGSTVNLDMKQGKELWQAMAEDDIAGYVDEYGAESGELDPPGKVN